MPITMRDANSEAGNAPAAPAQPVMGLPGPRIRLRPFRNDEVETAWQGLAQQDEAAHPRRRPEDRRPQPSEQFRRRLRRSGRLWRGCLDLAIDRDGRLVGTIQARTRPRQTLPAGVYEIGVILYQPRDRGKRYGAEAVELLTTWLFESGKAERVRQARMPATLQCVPCSSARDSSLRGSCADTGKSAMGPAATALCTQCSHPSGVTATTAGSRRQALPHRSERRVDKPSAKSRIASQYYPATSSTATARTVTYSYVYTYPFTGTPGSPLTNSVRDSIATTPASTTTITATVDLLGRAVSYTDALNQTTTTSYIQPSG
jgi:RimJ/RimL family protein N-acetyltransferase